MKRSLSILLLLIWLPASAWADDEKKDTPTGPRETDGKMNQDGKQKTLTEIQAAADRFRAMTHDYDREMKTLVLREVRDRRRFLEKSYGKRIEDIDVVQRARRLEAIEALERFVARYPNHQEHTPDAMFRLAELYYEKAQVDHDVHVRAYERDMDLYDRGKIPSEPGSPKVNFAEATKLYGEIIRRFKGYRFRDVAYYMKGYTQYQTGLERDARDTWLALAKTYPESRYTAEAWMRVGEYHFDYGEWKQARSAYLASAKYPKGKFYDMVLYKLAWTYFQEYDYDSAIKGFLTLIAHYDSKSDKGVLGSALREEAVSYLARSLAEDDWNGDGEIDPEAGVGRAFSYLSKGEPYELSILLEYAKALYELHEPDKYKESAQVYRKLIDRDPLNANNPEYHERLIETYDLALDTDGAARERDELVKRYARGTDWYKANLGNAKATTRADRLVEVALRQRAKFHHVAAQNLKVQARTDDDPAKLLAAKAEYAKAAAAYRQYLKTYPHRRESNEIRYLLAEALYYSDKFMEAAAAYAAVRDLKGKNEYQETAAFSAIKSVERHIEIEVQKKRIPAKLLAEEANDPPEPKEGEKRGTKIIPMKAEALPDAHKPWVEHTDKYVAMELVHEDDKDFNVGQAYRIGLMFYNFRHYDEARKRFEALIKKWTHKKEASFAAMLIVNTYKDENNWAKIEEWTNRIVAEELGDPIERAKLVKAIKTFKLGQAFDRCMAYLEEKDYVPAAECFEKVVNQSPKTKVGDKALFNAAIAYQKSKRYSSAARVFERIATEPRFKGSKYREEALFYMAQNSEKFFAFERAVSGYMSLRRSFPKSKWADYALATSALLEEQQGNLESAAKLYEKYATDYDTKDDAPRAYYQAGLVYEKLDDQKAQNRLWKDYIRRYQKDPRANAGIVQANLKLALLYHKQNNWKGAKKYYEKTIEEFEARALQPGSTAADYAAEARFALIDRKFGSYEKLYLRGSLANQGRIIQDKRRILGELQTEYEGMVPYKSFGWTVAAFFRVGQLYQGFAKMLYEAPDPPGLGDEEMDEYRTMVEDEGLKWENVAIQRYEVAVVQSRKLQIVNEWSQLALKALNKFKPADYPLFKSEKRAYDSSHDGPIGLSTEQPAADAPPQPEEDGKPSDPEGLKTPEPTGEVPVPGDEDKKPAETEPGEVPVPIEPMETQPGPEKQPETAPPADEKPEDELEIPLEKAGEPSETKDAPEVDEDIPVPEDNE